MYKKGCEPPEHPPLYGINSYKILPAETAQNGPFVGQKSTI